MVVRLRKNFPTLEDEYLEEDRYAQEVNFFEEREDPKTDKDTEENQAWIKRQKGHKACREELILKNKNVHVPKMQHNTCPFVHVSHCPFVKLV